MTPRPPSYDIRITSLHEVASLCERFHGYGGAGSAAVYAFGVYENDDIVAAYAWQPPPVGAAKSVCPEAPYGVLALSRMVAIPRTERKLNHVSKPLRRQMHKLIDRGRWPVLITYSDRGQGHTGYVYKCSGWQKTHTAKVSVYEDDSGKRQSRYSNGKTNGRMLIAAGYTIIDRWEHWICDKGKAREWIEDSGWVREPIPGKVWRSGNAAYRFVKPLVF